MPHPLVILLVGANLLTFGLFAWDKRAARLRRRRVPESRLLLSSLLAGGLPTWLYMSLLRHKTRKRSFVIKQALVTLLDVGLLYFWSAR